MCAVRFSAPWPIGVASSTWPMAVQAKLLRVLQRGQLQRLGSDREHQVDVRVIATTSRDLAAEVHGGRFRADFYHRLSVYPLVVPPLRERG